MFRDGRPAPESFDAPSVSVNKQIEIIIKGRAPILVELLGIFIFLGHCSVSDCASGEMEDVGYLDAGVDRLVDDSKNVVSG